MDPSIYHICYLAQSMNHKHCVIYQLKYTARYLHCKCECVYVMCGFGLVSVRVLCQKKPWVCMLNYVYGRVFRQKDVYVYRDCAAWADEMRGLKWMERKKKRKSGGWRPSRKIWAKSKLPMLTGTEAKTKHKLIRIDCDRACAYILSAVVTDFCANDILFCPRYNMTAKLKWKYFNSIWPLHPLHTFCLPTI